MLLQSIHEKVLTHITGQRLTHKDLAIAENSFLELCSNGLFASLVFLDAFTVHDVETFGTVSKELSLTTEEQVFVTELLF